MSKPIYVIYKGYKTIFFDSALRSSLALIRKPLFVIENIIKKVKEEANKKYNGKISVNDIKNIIISELEKLDKKDVERYLTYQKFKLLRRKGIYKKPLIIAITSGPTIGKSLLASELISRFGFTRVIFTDELRQELRSLVDKKKYPYLFVHTWDAYKFLADKEVKKLRKKYGEQPIFIYGFVAQSLLIIDNLLKKVVKKLYNEGLSALIEGVHLIPGEIPFEKDENYIPFFLEVNEDIHRNMVIIRGLRGIIKDIERDIKERLKEFSVIRAEYNFLYELAKKHKYNIINIENFEEAVYQILDVIYTRVKNIVNEYGKKL